MTVSVHEVKYYCVHYLRPPLLPVMTAACLHPLLLYRPRDPQASELWRLMDRHFETFQRVYDERFQVKYGYWRPIVERSVTAYLRCGDLDEGFARVRCGDCGHEMFVAFSCKQRCTCPSCHQKRMLLTAIHVAEEVCSPVAHRQVVLTIPKRLRVHTRFDRTLLGKLCAAAWGCILAEVRRLLGRDEVVPGMIAAIQTHGELLHWHPHIHALVTCGAFTAEGEFLDVPELDLGRLEPDWQEAVFALYLAEEKVTPEVVENMCSWPHSGFSVDQSVYLPAGDRAGIERLVGYITRCPFSLSRLVKVTEAGGYERHLFQRHLVDEIPAKEVRMRGEVRHHLPERRPRLLEVLERTIDQPNLRIRDDSCGNSRRPKDEGHIKEERTCPVKC
ncbi:MAG: transposase [Phycisphaerae bacterium]|nr:transposase [Phycisphaerae bacterium]